ncbi:beta-1,3-galactosyl-O-glycosyl-glycoprotein beta-1,6-N-acetylglucosaminyltransferase 3-like [Babylonia areolata]|uniref:beta-1,3-galactosyl-O-glycosyl-glycoprotein beta-1,6-N-acetylglucosaminyltransferase 3-like n=1 Tax=Babylonia areolata TaxID=304850 RepID=UPI003FCEF7EA
MLILDSGIHTVTCGKLGSRQNITMSKAQLTSLLSMSPRHSSPELPDGSSVGCKSWRRKRGFERWPVTAEEAQFPLAFSFKVHKDPDMFVRLLSVVWRPHNVYCVHVDFKSPPDVYHHIANVTRCFDNVLLVRTRVLVVHASITSLEADLKCARLVLRSPVPWRYHINLCGQDFPLKTNLEMVQIVSALDGSNDVENYPPSNTKPFKTRHHIVDGKIQESGMPKPPFEGNLTLRKGSAYNTVSRAFLKWALKDQVHKDFLLWLNDTWAPDELFWATISYREAAPGGPRTTVRHDREHVLSKAVNWRWDPYNCRGTYVRAVCVFSSLDLPWLLARHELVANKFNGLNDSLILECLEQELERRALAGFTEWLLTVATNSQQSREYGDSLLPSSSSQQEGVSRHSNHHNKRDVTQRLLKEVSKSSGPWVAAAAAGRGWPRLSSLNWSLYRSLPQFP